jgi:hypothetical protein
VGEWTGTLPASEATRFFELAAELEPKADEEAKRVLVTDGTMFEFVHKQRDQLRRTRMSAAAQGDSGRLARLMLDVAARFVRRGLPNSPDWKASEPPVDTTSGPALSPPPMIDDSHHSDRTRVSYAFNCAGMKIRLGYRQEERDLDSVGGDMARALPVDLTGIEVSGRRISAQDRRTIEDLMRSFARIEYVTAECFDREVTLTVKGMNLQRWLDYFRPAPAGVRKERPVATVREIRISAAGAVSIS